MSRRSKQNNVYSPTTGVVSADFQYSFLPTSTLWLARLVVLLLFTSFLIQPITAEAQEVSAETEATNQDVVQDVEIVESFVETADLDVDTEEVLPESAEQEIVAEEESETKSESATDQTEQDQVDVVIEEIVSSVDSEQDSIEVDVLTEVEGQIDTAIVEESIQIVSEEVETSPVADVSSTTDPVLDNLVTATQEFATSSDSIEPTVASTTDVLDNETEDQIEPANESASNASSSEGENASATSEAQSVDESADEQIEEVNEEDAAAAFPNQEDTDSSVEIRASSTEAVNEESVESTVAQVTITQGEYSFNKSECTIVEDGSYYCQKADLNPQAEDGLFAASDSDGDLELFLRRDGIEQQITDNVYDDASPYYDSLSETIVWHRLVNDRYQIVSYDISSAEEQVITDTNVNNMQPTRSEDSIVWQRWVGDNWEIILWQDGEELQLTDSQEHDIAPHVRGDLVIWNVRSGDGVESLMTYDINSRLYNEIIDSEGVAVANPRMVVMYESVFENGDVITKGFDLVTGEVIPLQQTPAELPEELPEPDSTGETRALVAPNQPKPAEDEVEDLSDQPEFGDDPESTTSTTSSAVRIATTTSDLTLDLTPAAATSTSTTSLESVSFDLDLSTSTLDVLELPEDVVIATSSTQTD